MNALQILLRNSIDYAGLFPPAGLDMGSAVANYADYRTGDAAWALGRFVVSAARLSELERAADRHLRAAAQPWQLAVLCGTDLSADLDLVADFSRRQQSARVDTVELKADSAAAITDTMHRIPGRLQVYIEIPIDRDPAPLLESMAGAGARAKVRTGGITQEAFPSSADLIRFVGGCVQRRVQFKATAGLHHPVRAEYRLTYAPESSSGLMFGFLNLFLAAAFVRAGMDLSAATGVLEERSAAAFRLDHGGLCWRGDRLSLNDLRRARQEVISSFGSCSFTEPLGDLEALHLLQPQVKA